MKIRTLLFAILPLLSLASASFAVAPVIYSVSPAFGSVAGGTSVTLTGIDFTGATAVAFGANAAASFTVNDDSTITATSPAGTKGTVHISVTTASGPSSSVSGDQFTYTSGSLIISEFRLRGPNGANDEYIEIYNPTGVDHTVVAGGTGYGVAASDGITRFSIPNGTVIPAYGHYLGVNSVGYSLASYPAGNGATATGDATYTTDIPDNAGIALFNNNTGGGSYILANRLDAVGSTSEANTLYKEGTSYPALTPFSINYCFHRIYQQSPATAAPSDTTVSLGDGQPRDTDNNSTDFVFEDTNGTSAGAGQRLGAPGPKNLSSPRAGYPMVATNLSRTLFDSESGLSVSPNRVRDLTSDPANNSTFGTLDFRRTFTNNTGANITRLRFRILKLTTFPAPSGTSDLRPRTSTDLVVGAATVRGTTLEQPPSQPNGGGFNSSFSVGAVSLATPLASGASINVRFLFGIQQTGNFRFLIVAEGLPNPLSQLWYVGGATETAADTETIGNAPSIASPTSASVASTTATLGGNVTSDGGATVTERGIVYAVTSTSSNPQIGDTGVTKVAGTGTTGVFTVAVTGLAPSTAYSYKAYATNGVSTSYTSAGTFTTLSNNANLVGLTPSAGTLSPVFAQGTTSYTATVANSVTGLTVTPNVAQPGATVTVNTVAVTSGTASGTLPLTIGINTITAVVTAPDATTTKTYTVTVTRLGVPALAATLTASGTFVGGTNVTYTATIANSGTTTQPDNVGNEFSFVLPSGLTLVSASASAGTAVATIGTGTVTWNGSLAASASVTLTITATINPATVGAVSAQGTVNYDADLDGANESSALTDDPGVLGSANPTVFTAISNNANLAGLTPSAGTLSPVFAQGTTSYTATVANFVTGLTVTPNVAQPGATVTVNTVAVTSGAASGTLPLNLGSNTITVIVTAPDATTTKTYTVTVTRLGAPALAATLTASGTFVGGTNVTYTATVANSGTATQPDNVGNEFSLVLPGGLTLVSASASSGTAVAIIGTGTVAWNGSLAASASVTLTITATINPATVGAVSAQGTVNYDADLDGANESSALTDDPGVLGSTNPTVFTAISPNHAPTFAGSTTTLSVTQNSSATNLKPLLHATDADSEQTLTWSIAEGGSPAHGTLTIASTTAASGTDVTPGGTMTYTPANGYSGSDSFTISLSDGAASATRTIAVTVVPVPVPVISSALTASGTYGTAFATYTIAASNTPTAYSATGLPAGLSVDTETGAITGTPTQAGSFDVTLGATNAGGTGNATLAIAIAKKTLTIAGVTARDKVYDGSLSTTLITTGATLGGVVGDDAVTLVKTDATATFADAAAGAAKPVTISGFTLTGAAAGNYTLSQPAGLTAAIIAAPQTITFASLSGKLTTDASFTLAATSSAGLPIAYTIVSGPAMLSGNTVTLTGASGWVVIRASQPGNSGYAAADDVTHQFLVSALGPQIFFGRVGAAPASSGPQVRTVSVGVSVAVNLAKDNSSGTLIGYLAATGQGFVLNFTPDVGGAFSGTAQVYASDTASTVSSERSARSVTTPEGSVLASTFAISGTVLNGTVSGTIAEPAVTFSATIQPQTGPTSDLAGYYIAPATNTASGSAFVIVDANSSAFVLAVTPTLVAAGTGANSASGELNATLGTSTFTGAINGATTTVAASLAIPGTGAIAFGGVKGSTLRTDRLVNLSARAPSGPGEKVLIAGFIIGGTSPKRVLLRGVGPTLQSKGVNAPLANPQLKLFNSAGALVTSNDDWSDPALAAAATLTGAFALPAGSKDSALLTTLSPGTYTLHVSDPSGATGVALAEIYDATENPQADYQRLINISSRGQVGGGENLLIGGFVVTGNSPKRVLIRGVGPALTPLGVSAVLADPALKLYQAGVVVAQNDNWETPVVVSTSQTAATAATLREASGIVGAFALPAGSKDAALIVTLAPGVYSAAVSGVDASTGIALVEVYEIP